MSTTVSGRASVPAQPTGNSTDPATGSPAGRTRTDTVRDAIHVGACVLAGVLVTAGFALDPAIETETGAETIAAVAESPDLFYWSNTMAGFGLAMIAAVGLAVLRLVRGRGRAVATVGGVLTIIGAAASGAAIFMYGAVLTGLVESGEEQEVLASLQDSLSDSSRPGLAFLLGFAGMFLGLLISVVALLMARAVALWVAGALLAGIVVVIAFSDTAFSPVGDVLLTVGLAGIGLTLWRSRTATRVT